jgi:hypothetical protein
MAYKKSVQETMPVAARGILTRINPEGLKALRQLGLDRDTTVQALMIGAANDQDPQKLWANSGGN